MIRLSPMSPSLYLVTYMSTSLCIQKPTSELSYGRQDLGLGCNDIILKRCKMKFLIMILNSRRRELKRGLFLDICIPHEAKNQSDG